MTKGLTICAFLVMTLIPFNAWSSQLESYNYRTAPDQVLVIYNADWTGDQKGSDPGQDSREIAEYYVRMHTDPKSGKKPYLLGLRCKHGKDHLNSWKIEEVSHDNKNGVVFKGKGRSPENDEWVRDSKKVEIVVADGNADWNSVIIRCRSDVTGEEKMIYRDGKDTGVTEVAVAGLPATNNWQRTYPLPKEGQGRSFRFDASRVFPGKVTVFFSVRDSAGRVIRDLDVDYYDISDFEFSANGSDGISDEKILDEDVLTPIRDFLESPANALADGTLLKDHIVYIVLVHGMPYSGSGAFGIEHGTTPRKGDHGVLASLEQRIQTLYYGWGSRFIPPVVSMYMAGGPDAEKGVVNNIITTAMRYPLAGFRWNPYMHPDTYSFLGRDKNKPPHYYYIASLSERRKVLPDYIFAYAVTRIDGGTVEEAKRIIDYSLYASRYLRPEMDCFVREKLKREKKNAIDDMEGRLKAAEKENLWGAEELKKLGFRVISSYENQGVPFMVMPRGLIEGKCDEEPPKWGETGFYPGGIGRQVVSNNGWNSQSAPIWQYLKKGVTVSACGAPAYDGGPHITNATFWDNRILMRYLFRGKDLGEAFLLSSFYVNWSTSLTGDPLMHPDLRETVTDNTPPSVEDISVTTDYGTDGYSATIKTTVGNSYEDPEVALLSVSCLDTRGQEVTGTTGLFSRRPTLQLKSLAPDMDYVCKATFRDPYDNATTIPSVKFKVEKASLGKKLFLGVRKIINDVK
jgi:hypothetical protein